MWLLCGKQGWPGPCQETCQEAIALINTRVGSDLSQGGDSGKGDRCSYFEPIMKVEPIIFPTILDLKDRKKRVEVFKDEFKVKLDLTF